MGEISGPFLQGFLVNTQAHFLIAFMHRGIKFVLGQLKMIGEKLPAEEDGLFFEVVTEREVPQHLKKGVVPGSAPHIAQIIMLAPTELLEKVGKWINEHPNIIFASKAEGIRKDALIITLHRNYTEYARFLEEIRVRFGAYTQDHESIIIPLEEPLAKPLSLKGLREQTEN